MYTCTHIHTCQVSVENTISSLPDEMMHAMSRMLGSASIACQSDTIEEFTHEVASALQGRATASVMTKIESAAQHVLEMDPSSVDAGTIASFITAVSHEGVGLKGITVSSNVFKVYHQSIKRYFVSEGRLQPSLIELIVTISVMLERGMAGFTNDGTIAVIKTMEQLKIHINAIAAEVGGADVEKMKKLPKDSPLIDVMIHLLDTVSIDITVCSNEELADDLAIIEKDIGDWTSRVAEVGLSWVQSHYDEVMVIDKQLYEVSGGGPGGRIWFDDFGGNTFDQLLKHYLGHMGDIDPNEIKQPLASMDEAVWFTYTHT